MKNNIIYDNNKLHLIVLCDGNWNLYANNKYIYYIAKKSSSNSGVYCATYKFKNVLLHNARVKKSNIIPYDWNIKDHDFFKKLGIIK